MQQSSNTRLIVFPCHVSSWEVVTATGYTSHNCKHARHAQRSAILFALQATTGRRWQPMATRGGAAASPTWRSTFPPTASTTFLASSASMKCPRATSQVRLSVFLRSFCATRLVEQRR